MTRTAELLVRRGWRVAVVKHSHHPPDLRGKDSDRFARAGAQIVVFAGRGSFVRFRGPVGPLLPVLPADAVLVEGFSRRKIGDARFRVARPEDAAEIVGRILKSLPPRPPRSILWIDGRRAELDPLWRLVANLMEVRKVRRVQRFP